MDAYARLLRNRRFALLWSGATLSLFGDGLTWVSLVWLAYELGGTTVEVSILAACYTAPVIIGGLGAGVLLDRYDRRRLLMLDNAIRGLAMASVPVAAAAGALTIGQLYAVAAVYGLLYMVSLAGFPSMLPDVVDDADLPTANAMESISFAIGGVAGPAVAGVLIGVIGAANVLAVDAITYGGFVACLALFRLRPKTSPIPGAEPDAGRGLRPAVGFVLRTPAILAITLMFMAFNLGEGMLLVLLPAYARNVLDAGAAGYGLLVSSFTVGVLAGSLAIGGIRWPWPLGRSIAVAQLASGVAALGLLLQPALFGAAAVLAVMGLLASPLTIWAQTIRMRLIPEILRGRVFGLLRTMMQGTPPLGAIGAGVLVAAAGPAAAVGLIAALIGVPGVVGLVHRALAEEATMRPADRAADYRSPA